jgi:hypothetical protein
MPPTFPSDIAQYNHNPPVVNFRVMITCALNNAFG